MWMVDVTERRLAAMIGQLIFGLQALSEVTMKSCVEVKPCSYQKLKNRQEVMTEIPFTAKSPGKRPKDLSVIAADS